MTMWRGLHDWRANDRPGAAEIATAIAYVLMGKDDDE